MAEYDAVCWRRSELNLIGSVFNINGRGAPRSSDTERFLDCWNKGRVSSADTRWGETTVRKVFTIGQTATLFGPNMRLVGG